MTMKRLCAVIAVAAAGMTAGSSFADVDPNLESYERVGGVSGNLSSVGSDSLANMMTLWAEEFKRHYPNVNMQIQAAGSSTAPPALTEGTSSLAPMSRKMKDSELQAFEEKYGYKPVEIPVAIDALAVFVHKDNPIPGLTMAQLDAVFSATRLCGNNRDITTWGEAGLDSQWTNRDIQLYGRNSVSGTYGYFKGQALCKGDFKNSVNEQPGSASVVQSISQSLNAIGYSGIGYRTSSVRTVPLAKAEGEEFIDATAEGAVTGKYPLSRFLYVYVNKAPNKQLAPLEREFVKLMLSKEGQATVFKDGYVPMPKRVVDKVYAELGL